MFCKHCGSTVDDGAAFCPVCGQAVDGGIDGAVIETVTTTTEETVVVKKPSDGAAQAEKPSGGKRLLYILGAIAAFLAVLVSFGLFYVSGLSNGEYTYWKVSDFFNFSEENGIIYFLSALMGGEPDGEMIGELGGALVSLLFSYIVILAVLITLLVEFIAGIVGFVKALTGSNPSKIGRVAVGAFGAYAVGMLLLLVINVPEAGVAQLSTETLAGVCIAAVLIGVYLVMHIIAGGKNVFRPAFLLKLIASVILIALGGVIAGLASSGSLIVLNGEYGQNFVSAFIAEMSAMLNEMFGGGENFEFNVMGLSYISIGLVAVVALVSIGVELVKGAVIGLSEAADGKKKQKSTLAPSIVGLVFSAILIAASYLYAKEFEAELNAAVPIIIAVISALGVVVSAIASKLFSGKKKEKKTA